MKKYLLVRDVPNKASFDAQMFDAESFRAKFSELGYPATGTEGGRHLREELRGEPVFEGLCGPMWGGINGGLPVVRYETWAVYERMSA
jgi:hypothetical protein